MSGNARWRKIAVSDLGDFWYGDYKEPFEQLEGAVAGYPKGAVLADDDGKLLCAYCGKTYDHLGSHVYAAHGLSGPDYKREVGLLKKTALVSERVRTPMVAAAVRREAITGHAKAFMEQRNQRPPHHLSKGVALAPEWANKTGQCAAQLLARARTIYRERGRITGEILRSHGIREHRVIPYFGSFDALIALVTGEPTPKRRWSDTELLALLSSLAATLNHTPRVSDMARYGMPTFSTYVQHFGSWAEACRRAGLDPNLPVPMTPELEVAVLSAYAIHGNMDRVARSLHLNQSRVSAVFHRYGWPYPAGYGGQGRREWAADMAKRLAGTAQDRAA